MGEAIEQERKGWGGREGRERGTGAKGASFASLRAPFAVELHNKRVGRASHAFLPPGKPFTPFALVRQNPLLRKDAGNDEVAWNLGLLAEEGGVRNGGGQTSFFAS